MTSVSAGHIMLTPTQPVGSRRPQRESKPGPPQQGSRALLTELPRPPKRERERERERETERERERKRQRDRERQTDRQTDRQTWTERRAVTEFCLFGWLVS